MKFICTVTTMFYFTIQFCCFCMCSSSPSNNIVVPKSESAHRIVVGAEKTETYFPQLLNKKISVVVNHSSRVGQTHLVDTLLSTGINIKNIFSPEHGFRGTADAGESINDGTDSKSGLPVFSLYGKYKKPSPEKLNGVELIVFDIQDIGVRFYTYISTLHYIMEAAAEQNIPVIVLDRPNPLRHIIDGPVLERPLKSFVGMHPVPVLYGMTIGEYARMINGESWLQDGIKCNLTVIPIDNYDEESRYILPIKPSPNLPNSIAIGHYPSLCFFEGTSLSIGRGTDFPFQVIGHPELLEQPFQFEPRSTSGAKYPKHEDEVCYGFDLRKVMPDQQKLNLDYLINFYQQCQKHHITFFNENNFFDLLAGTESLRKMIIDGLDADSIRASWQENIEGFELVRKKYLLY